MIKTSKALKLFMLLLVLPLIAISPATASSHREAPGILGSPQVDGTDFYMFRSYEAGRDGYVTFVANYSPLQDPYGGPNYFPLDPMARYDIRIDNTGDGVEDLSFVFQFTNYNLNISLPVGTAGSEATVAIPLLAAGQTLVQPGGLAALNQATLYTVDVVRGPISSPRSVAFASNGSDEGFFFGKPNDNAGVKTYPDYAGYAALYQADISVPGCDGSGRVFVGQRKESFAVNLGPVFDLVNLNPLGAPDAIPSELADKNITSMILELPIACVTGGHGPTIGAWTTARLPRERTLSSNPTYDQPSTGSPDFVQVSRLGMPLVNEVVIGVKDKNKFNASQPKDDLQFATYVTNPTLPELLQILFGVQAPNNFPRTDLLAAFVTGVTGLNEFGFGEMLRLNTDIAPTPEATQSNLGVLGGDLAGFPNGRRPGDDVVDIELRVAMGVLCHAFPGVYCNPADAPSGTLLYTDGTLQDAKQFDITFPYLTTPLPGA
ncbi:MAG: DUF4331 domain-containing protein [Thermoanaerobaculia bacterium]